MAELLILEFPGTSRRQYEAVSKELGIDPATGSGNWPAGLQSHTSGGRSDGALVVVEVWESQEEQAAFLQSRLGPAIAKVGVSVTPKVTWIPLYSHHELRAKVAS